MKTYQQRVNELLRNAWLEYNQCIRYSKRADKYADADDFEMYELYEQLSTEALHKCQTWLDAWEVMTNVHMKVYELGKFKPKDFKEARKAGLLAYDTLA